MKNNDFKDNKIDVSIWKQLFDILIIQKKYIIQLIVMLLIVAAIDVGFPLLNRYAIDYFAMGLGTSQEFKMFLLLYGVMVIAIGSFVFGYLKVTGIIEHNFAYELRQRAFVKVQELSFSYFDKNSEGWIISRLTSDIFRVTEILSWGLIDFLFGIMSIIGVVIIMLITNWKMALLIIMVLPILMYASFWFQSRILVQQRKVRKANSEVTAAFSESINGAKTIKSMAIEDIVTDEFHDTASKMRKSSIHANLYSALFIPVVIILSGVSTASIVWYGGSQVVSLAMQFGVLMMFTSYVNLFFQPLREISRLIAELQMAQASAERVMQLLNAKNEVVDTEAVIQEYGTIMNPKPEAYVDVTGHVEFKDVGFYYTENETVLDEFNINIKAGQTVALVGETGSGKSTIINLLCRFYEPTSGTILIDGIDYKERSLGWLRHNIGYVLQAPHLFSGSIKDNIRYGKLDATDEEVIAAAKRVNAHEFIQTFAEGYDSDVGEGGSRLSTGQKQLISFARAIIKNPSIFILDEATASIDTETEVIVQHAISDLLKDKTSFIVAHRLSTIIDADVILVIRDGDIVESGTHKELLANKNYYYRLYTNQFNEESVNAILQ